MGFLDRFGHTPISDMDTQTSFSRRQFCFGAFAAVGTLIFGKNIALADDSPTMSNLQKAYSIEMSAVARYTAYAKKADSEGYHQIASLFRAATVSEKIHADLMAKVIKKNGGNPIAHVERVTVQSTKANLQAAIKVETFESKTTYADNSKQARAERNKDAMKAFNYAKGSEANYIKLLNAALANMNAMKKGKKTYYVCRVCGDIADKLNFDKCPVCFRPKSEYDEYS